MHEVINNSEAASCSVKIGSKVQEMTIASVQAK